LIALMTDHYTALGLNSAATLADVKKAFRQKASFWHPDKNTAPDAAERFRTVQTAYDVLADADKRQAYDDNRRRNLLDSPIDTAREIWDPYFKALVNGAELPRAAEPCFLPPSPPCAGLV
jgi:curved DNA-binding protein CbpA